jgi:histidinol-phosphate aminotransferase
MNTERDRLAVILNGIPGVVVTAGARASFLLLHVAGGRDERRKEPSAGGPSVRERLRGAGFAVRRGDTFPGLGPEWLRVAVRDRATNDRFATALRQITRESDNDPNT